MSRLIRLYVRNAIGREFSYAETVIAPTLIVARQNYHDKTGVPISDIKASLAPPEAAKKIERRDKKENWRNQPRLGAQKLKAELSLFLKSIPDYTLLKIEGELRGKHGMKNIKQLMDAEIETRQKGTKR